MKQTDGHDGHGSQFFGVVGVNPFKQGTPGHNEWESAFFGASGYFKIETLMISCGSKPEGKELAGKGAWILWLKEHPKGVAEYHELAKAHMAHCKWVYCVTLWELAPNPDTIQKWLKIANQRTVTVEESCASMLYLGQHTQPLEPTATGWNASDPLPLLGATIITPGYEAMGEEAVKRFHQHTGLPCNVLRFSGDAGFAYKLALPDLLPPVPVVFFDADLWLLRPTDLVSQVAKGAVSAVPDPGTRDAQSFVALDCAKLGLERRQYFNSGLFIADFSCEHVRAAFRRAAKILEDKTIHEIADYGDQTPLNMAVQRSGVPFHPMPAGFNFFMHAVSHGYGSVPDLVYGLHAAGVKKADKLAHLKSHAAVFEFEDRSPKKTPPTVNPVIVYPADGQITNVFEANNDQSLPIAYRTERALRWVRDRPEHLIQGEALAALKVFLTYRVCEGLLTFSEWETDVAAVEMPTMSDGLAFRWAISWQTSVVYMMAIQGKLKFAWMSAVEVCSQIVNVQIWPAALCNLLRTAVIASYGHYLLGNAQQAAALISLVIDQWQKQMGGLDWKAHPMRFAEMREDREAILMLMVIAKANGLTTFRDHDWLHIPQMASGQGPFHRAVRAMNPLNPERAIWK
jgi:hypothetical protein